MSEMKVCSRCGNKFDPEIAKDIFESEHCLPYDNFDVHLCGKCAVEVIDDQEEGYYFEICERCGTKFDPIVASADFDSYREGPILDTIEEYSDGMILCCSCALDNWYKACEELREDDEWDDDSERISVEDAANIWLSNGKDEDYMFGYSEEELEDAL